MDFCCVLWFCLVSISCGICVGGSLKKKSEGCISVVFGQKNEKCREVTSVFDVGGLAVSGTKNNVSGLAVFILDYERGVISCMSCG